MAYFVKYKDTLFCVVDGSLNKNIKTNVVYSGCAFRKFILFKAGIYDNISPQFVKNISTCYLQVSESNLIKSIGFILK